MTSQFHVATFALLIAGLSVHVSTTAESPQAGAVAAQPSFVRVYAADTAGLVRPVIVRQSTPTYTSEALRAKVQGNVTLEITVDVDGRVRDALLKNGVDVGLDAAAVTAVGTWLFTPGTLEGKPVPVRLTMDLKFSIY